MTPPRTEDQSTPRRGGLHSSMRLSPDDTRGRMIRRWVALALFVVVLSVTFVSLGRWQLDRLDQRRDRNSVVVQHENAPVVPYEQLMNRPITDADQWQRVRVTGTFDSDHQLVVRYRSDSGDTGSEVVAPLRATDGRTVLVSRGFVPRMPGTDFLATAPPAPAGEVTIVGFVRRNEQGKPNQITPAQGSVRLINAPALSEWLGEPLVDGYIGVLEITPAQEGGFRPVSTPPLNDGSHLAYALQWFSFAVIAAVGLFVFIRNDLRDRRRAREQAARAADAASADPRADAPAASRT